MTGAWRIREESGLKAWVDSLGRVDWIVVGSSSHTLSLASVIAQYPEAKILGTNNSQEKMTVINALPRGKVPFKHKQIISMIVSLSSSYEQKYLDHYLFEFSNLNFSTFSRNFRIPKIFSTSFPTVYT